MSENSKDHDKEQVQQIANTVETLFEPGQVVELRGMIDKRQMGGFFTDPLKLATMAVAFEQEGCSCYIGLAPRDPKTCKPMRDLGWKKGRVEDVLERRWLLVDIDPERKGKCCSTDDEKAAAFAVLENVVKFLARLGWPAPVMADSGNGFHALYRIDLPVDDNGLVKHCLHTLAEKFDTEQAKVDKGVHDAPRIVRLYGTTNIKGENTDERPHRLTKIRQKGSLEKVPTEKIEELAAFAPQRIINQTRKLNTAIPIGDHCASTTAEKMGEYYDDPAHPLTPEFIIKRATLFVEKCDLAISGSGGDKQTYYVAWVLVINFGLSVAEALPIMREFNDRLRGAGEEIWTEAELLHKLESAEKQIAKQPEQVGKYLIPKNKSDNDEKQSQTDILLEIIDDLKLWHNEERQAFATIEINGVNENLSIESSNFKHWLGNAYYRRTKRVANDNSIKNVISAAMGRAIYDGEMEKTFVRVGGKDGVVFVDLGDAEWNCVELSKTGWKIIQNPPVKFRRVVGQQALPEPQQNGTVAELRNFLNVQGIDDIVLILCWLVGCFQPEAEYPLLVFSGQQGTGKSTAARVTRSLVCPNEATLRSSLKNESDFAVEAVNSWIIVLDNLSWIPDWLSDCLCRLATGGAIAKRALYTNSELSILRFCGPAILNGITDLASRPDLLDRCLLIELQPLQETKSKKKFWLEFEKVHGTILGGIFDAVVYALANPSDREDLPRMAGFAQWAVDAEPELARQWNEAIPDSKESLTPWNVGDFLEYYHENIAKASWSALDQSAIASYLITLIEQHGHWEGSVTELLSSLNEMASKADDMTTRSKSWPKNASSLSRHLQRLAPTLKRRGITAEQYRRPGGNRDRVWKLQTADCVDDESTDSTIETVCKNLEPGEVVKETDVDTNRDSGTGSSKASKSFEENKDPEPATTEDIDEFLRNHDSPENLLPE